MKFYEGHPGVLKRDHSGQLSRIGNHLRGNAYGIESALN
jgi:hypothetical protein